MTIRVLVWATRAISRTSPCRRKDMNGRNCLFLLSQKKSYFYMLLNSDQYNRESKVDEDKYKWSWKTETELGIRQAHDWSLTSFGEKAHTFDAELFSIQERGQTWFVGFITGEAPSCLILRSEINFSIFCSVTVISTILSSRSLIHSSASLILLLILSSVLFISVCLFFSFLGLW